ncbi:MAG: hypothetical protein R2851_19035 [Caldilineaceae bacterium]
MPKILLLLAGMIFLVTVVRTFFSVEQTRPVGRQTRPARTAWPPCWASSPRFAPVRCRSSSALWKAGFRWASLFFLIAAPMVNDTRWPCSGLFGWQNGLYLTTGLIIAVVAGLVIGRIPWIERGLKTSFAGRGRSDGRARGTPHMAGTLRHRLAQHARSGRSGST